MEELRSREFDFGSKLRQESIIQRLREYISWQRNSAPRRPPHFGPISINLDLTSACNFSCPHCVDSRIINTGEYLRLDDLKRTIRVLHSHGLLSVILLGGGEPTLHRNFEEIVGYIKSRGLELGIVTNGSRLDKVAKVTEFLGEKDWIRISLDAAKEDTFRKLHWPKNNVTLSRILHGARGIKDSNPLVSLGYSFVIVWDGLHINGKELTRNTDEITEAAKLAGEFSFDFISFKPCLVRLEGSQKESLLDKVGINEEEKILKEIKASLHKAKNIVDDRIKILESVNLQAMMNKEVDQLKRQPKRCHMQFFRTVVTPSGIFHCPAFRGVEKAKIAESDGYVTESKFDQSLKSTARSISAFNAEDECNVVGCFYHHVNWWLEEFTNSDRDVAHIEKVGDDNFFL